MTVFPDPLPRIDVCNFPCGLWVKVSNSAKKWTQWFRLDSPETARLSEERAQTRLAKSKLTINHDSHLFDIRCFAD